GIPHFFKKTAATLICVTPFRRKTGKMGHEKTCDSVHNLLKRRCGGDRHEENGFDSRSASSGCVHGRMRGQQRGGQPAGRNGPAGSAAAAVPAPDGYARRNGRLCRRGVLCGS